MKQFIRDMCFIGYFDLAPEDRRVWWFVFLVLPSFFWIEIIFIIWFLIRYA